MIHQIASDKHNVLAFKVSGTITEEEVNQTIATIESAIEIQDQFNLYIELASLDGAELAAIKERFSFIFSNYKTLVKKVKKVSFVSDKNWLQKFSQGIYRLIPSIEQKSFSFEETEQARQFVGLEK